MMRISRIPFSTSFLLAGIILCGRFSGFVREIQIATVFGLSSDADFAVVLLTAPDLFANLLLAGGLSAALIPEFRALDAESRSFLFMRVAAIVTGIFAVIGLLVALKPAILLALLAPAYVGSSDVYWLPFALMAIAIPLSGLSGVTGALLNSQGRFMLVGGGTLIFNITLIGAFFFLSKSTGLLVALAVAITLGAGLRVASQLVGSAPFIVWRNLGVMRPDSRGIALRFAAALGAASITLLVPVLMRSALSFAGEGVIAAFNYATKLVELPLGIAITSITTVVFTRLSDQLGAAKREQAEKTFAAATVAAAMVGLSICMPAVWFSHSLTQVVFGWGRMTANDIDLVSDLAAIGMLTIPLVAISGMSAAMLNAEKKSGLVLRCTLTSLLVLPFALGPGLVLADPRLAMLTLPVFHLVLAVILARAARLRIPTPILYLASRRLVVLGATFGAAIALDFAFVGIPLIFRVGLALGTMAAAVLLSGARSTLSSLRL